MNDHTKKHEIFAMGQYDPIIDYYMSTKSDGGVDYDSTLPENYAKSDQDDTYSNYDFHLYRSSSLFFLHANWPKYYLERLFCTIILKTEVQLRLMEIEEECMVVS